MHKISVNNIEQGYKTDIHYDINIAVLIHYVAKYKKRISPFKKFGLLNTNAHKVHVTLLGSVGDWKSRSGILADWPQDCDVTLLEMSSIYPIPKIHGYYMWLKDSKLQARWHMRIDDDSLTDVDNLLKYVDVHFGNLPVHVMTSPHDGRHNAKALADHLEYLNISIPSYRREYESSITSASGMQKVFAHENAMKFIESSGRAIKKPGDQALAFAMHIAKVAVANNKYASKNFKPTELTIAGGGLHHIHYVNWSNTHFVELLDAMLHGKTQGIDPDVFKMHIGRPMDFGRIPGSPFTRLTLLHDGSIDGGADENEMCWRYDTSLLMFTKPNGLVTTIFNRVMNHLGKTWLVGPHLYGSRTHYLTASVS